MDQAAKLGLFIGGWTGFFAGVRVVPLKHKPR